MPGSTLPLDCRLSESYRVVDVNGGLSKEKRLATGLTPNRRVSGASCRLAELLLDLRRALRLQEVGFLSTVTYGLYRGLYTCSHTCLVPLHLPARFHSYKSFTLM